MAIFKKKANKERGEGARSPTGSPPVQQQPSLTAAVQRGVSDSYAPAAPNMNPRRMTASGYAPPDRSSVQTPTGRASPAPGPGGYPLGMGLPSTMGSSIPPASVSGSGPPSSGPISPLGVQSPGGPPQAPANPGYPWTTRPLRLFQPPGGGPLISPFPRYGLSVPPYPSHSGHMLLFGGLVRDRAHNDLWSLDVRDGSLQHVKTRGEAPLPRIGHVSAIADRIMIVFGGDTKIHEDDQQDNGLYVLDLRTQEWTSVPVTLGPCGRYGHAACMLGGIFYVHGGHVDGRNFDDLWAFDIRQLGQDGGTYTWKRVEYNGAAPLARTGHTLVPYRNKLYLFGGTDGDYHYNDSWSFDISTGVWSELECIGYIPIPREGHAAAIVDDVVYVFGGRDVHGKDLGDLAAFRIGNQRWYMFQNMGPSPMAKSGHSLCAAHGKVFVIGGESNLGAAVQRDDPNMVHVLDTTKIKYPSDSTAPSGRQGQANQPPRGRTTSDATDRRPANGLSANGPYGTGANNAAYGSRSHDNLARSMSPTLIASEPRPLIIANDTGANHSKTHTRGSESLDSGPPMGYVVRPPNGVPPQRPKREGDDEYRWNMAHPEAPIMNGTPDQSSSSPTDESRVVTPSAEVVPRRVSPPPGTHVASHTVHPNTVRTTRSPPPELRVTENGRPAMPPDAFYFGAKSPTAGSRPTSMLGRPNSILGRPGSIVGNRPGSMAGTADLMREIKARETEADNARRREAALRVILSKAIQQGYVVDDDMADVPPPDLLKDNPQLRQIATALMQLKHEKANLQNDVATQMRTANERIAESERLQKAALQEAAYYRAKMQAMDAHNAPEVQRLETERINDLERQLESTATEHASSQRELDGLKSDIQRHQDLSSTATDREAETLQRAEAAEEELAKLQEELESLRTTQGTHDRTIREHSERFVVLNSTTSQREAERDQYKEQLDQALQKHNEYLILIEQAQGSLSTTGARAAELENMHGRAKEQITSLEEQLAETRRELENKAREAEQATARLAEVESLHNTTREEATKLRELTNGHLGQLVQTSRAMHEEGGTRSLKGHTDQLRALEEEKSSLLKLLRDAGERVDATEAAALSHRQKAREIETAHNSLRADMRVHRTKLLTAQSEISKYRDLFSAKDTELRERDQAVTELQTRVALMRKLLGEHGINVSDAELDSAEHPSASDLESKLRDKSRAHDNVLRENEELNRRCNEAEQKAESLARLMERYKDARSPSAASMRSPSPSSTPGLPTEDADRRAVVAERKLAEIEAEHAKRITNLQGDYETAVRYVKSTEKMLNRMKVELNKQKSTNTGMREELDTLRGRAGSVEPGMRSVSGQSMSGRTTPAVDGEVGRRLQALQHQYASLQAELKASQDVLSARNREFDLLRMRSDEADRENEALREDLAQAQHRIETLLAMNQTGIHLGDSDDDEDRAVLRRGSSASSDGGASTAFDKFAKELKQWERARSPDAESEDYRAAPLQGPPANQMPHANGPNSLANGNNNPFTQLAAGGERKDVYSGDWTQ